MAILSLKKIRSVDDNAMSEELVSIIIPARNEEKNIEGIIKNLQNQTYENIEIIVANDASVDNTAALAISLGVEVVDAIENEDSFPKPNACHSGFLTSKGNIIVFLDADVRVSQNFIGCIVKEISTGKECISYQPYHKRKNVFEELSLFFHIASVIGSGLFSLIPFNVGLYGPCIAMTKKVYEKTNGYNNKNVKQSIVEDIALSNVMKEHNVDTSRSINKKIIQYRMYEKLPDLINGWRKNIARGAGAAPLIVVLSIVLFFGFLISATTNLLLGDDIVFNAISLGISFFLLFLVARRVGDYLISIVFFPVSLLFFIGVFILAIYDKAFKRDVRWKDRSLKWVS